MDAVERFVIDGNISRFVGMLRDETNPARQDMLRRLLIAEEDRFGLRCDCLQAAERHLMEGAATKRLLAHREGNGGDVGAAERALQRYVWIQDAFHSLRVAVQQQLERRA
jgi:hypothetical protein